MNISTENLWPPWPVHDLFSEEQPLYAFILVTGFVYGTLCIGTSSRTESTSPWSWSSTINVLMR